VPLTVFTTQLLLGSRYLSTKKFQAWTFEPHSNLLDNSYSTTIDR